MHLETISQAGVRLILAGILAGAPTAATADEAPKANPKTTVASPETVTRRPSEAAPKNPSWFKADADGVLWFQEGDDGQTEYSSSLILSAVTDGIVITVTANGKHVEDAVSLAKKMKTVLESGEHTPDEIPIVAVGDDQPGVGYTFYTDGLRVTHEDYDNKGVFNPTDAKSKKVLSRVAKHYRILREEYVPAGKWGKDHADWTALRIVRTQK